MLELHIGNSIVTFGNSIATCLHMPDSMIYMFAMRDDYYDDGSDVSVEYGFCPDCFLKGYMSAPADIEMSSIINSYKTMLKKEEQRQNGDDMLQHDYDRQIKYMKKLKQEISPNDYYGINLDIGNLTRAYDIEDGIVRELVRAAQKREG